jgi:cob(I)alamin adenosyltransferase
MEIYKMENAIEGTTNHSILLEERIESLETAVKSMQEALEKLKQFVGYKQ